ncbi:hypothetical protein GII33_11405 [Gordonia pseudamarae]|uniref:Uncharacterized protein n=1 Tax=Gordonia pseudamarae TaxID=2831662 RepID=A0ABX6IHN2_9ACTN|nr:hypothetical protein GII33_11405 [Gordonia pseudamarae]QHN35377.1 hypothetical protein GII31_11225 [Gordonia pseudamarae]
MRSCHQCATITGHLGAVADDPAAVARPAADGHRSVGIGSVRLPLPASTRAGRGPAFE